MKAKRLACALLVISLVESVAQQPVIPITTNVPATNAASKKVGLTGAEIGIAFSATGIAHQGPTRTNLWGDPVVGTLSGIGTNQNGAAIPPPPPGFVIDPPSAIGMNQNGGDNEAARKEFLGIKAKAEKGDATNQFLLGAKYEMGQGVPTNLVEALKWFRKAAEQDCVEAQVILAFCYENGDGVT